MKKFREKASANYQIRLRPNRELENVFRAYETSWETERLESEQNRQIYCELIDLGQKKDLKKISKDHVEKPAQISSDKPKNDDDDEDDKVVAAVDDTSKPKWWTQVSVESNRPRTLVEISINEIGKNYKSGSISDRIWCLDAEDIGLLVDIELPMLDFLELNNETFWKRVVQVKLRDVLKLQNLLRDPNTNWKKIGLELKLTELIENLEQTVFDEPVTAEHLKNVIEKLKDYVEHLSIKQLKARKRFDKKPFNDKARVVNFTSDECFHGSLEFLSGLINLKDLSIKFDPGLQGWNYERRFFQVAAVDLENIGKALTSLKKLEKFAILQSDLSEPMKISYLLVPMQTMEQLSVINLSDCAITSKISGQHFEEFLTINRSLKHLELKGNILGMDFCFHFAQGIKKFAGKLNYLGLSLTPILGNGLGSIVKSIRYKKNVERLDISKCDNGMHGKNDDDVELLTRLIEKQGFVQAIDMNDNLINNQLTKENFIKALEKNYKIIELNCENCGFELDEMLQIKVLVLRNNYYKDNPILKKDHFTAEDEIEVEKFLKRTKHPLLLQYKKVFTPSDDAKKPYGIPPRENEIETTENYTNFASST